VGIGAGAVLVPDPVRDLLDVVEVVCVEVRFGCFTVGRAAVASAGGFARDVVTAPLVVVVCLGDDVPPQPSTSAATSASIPTCWSVLTVCTVAKQSS
jgi:hypothetical protein